MTRKKSPPRSRQVLEREILLAGRVMSTAAVMFHTALAEKQGLSVTEEKAIDLLARFGPISAGDLSTKSGLAPASVTGLIDRLERKGFAERVKSPEDGRKVLVKLREDPAQAFAPHFAYFVGGLEQLLAGYTVEQLEAILHFMTESTALQQRATARLSGTPEEPT